MYLATYFNYIIWCKITLLSITLSYLPLPKSPQKRSIRFGGYLYSICTYVIFKVVILSFKHLFFCILRSKGVEWRFIFSLYI